MQETSAASYRGNHSQAVRPPADVRLPEGVKKVLVRARGLDRIISPWATPGIHFFLGGPMPTDDFMAKRADMQQAERQPSEQAANRGGRVD